MATDSPEGVQHTRMLQTFKDFRDTGLEAAKLFAKRMDPDNGILMLLARAIQHRNEELRVTYDDQWRQNPG